IAIDVLTFRVDLGDLPARVAIALLLGWLAAGLLLIAADESGMFRPAQSLGAAARSPSLAWVGIGSVEAIVIVGLVAILVLFFIYASIAWLGLALAATAVLLMRDRMGYLAQLLGAATIVIALGANVIGPATFVAQQNVDRAIDPTLVPSGGLTGLDVEYVQDL